MTIPEIKETILSLEDYIPCDPDDLEPGDCGRNENVFYRKDGKIYWLSVHDRESADLEMIQLSSGQYTTKEQPQHVRLTVKESDILENRPTGEYRKSLLNFEVWRGGIGTIMEACSKTP